MKSLLPRLTLKSALASINQSLQAELRTNDYIDRIWIYKDLCVVVDFIYQGVKFGFNCIPLEDGRTFVNAIERKHSSSVVLITNTDKKLHLSSGTTIEKACELIKRQLTLFQDEIDDKITSPKKINLAADNINSPPRSPSPKRVGVMTLPLNSNYGGNLQAFAMMQALSKLGHAPVFINRRNPEANVAGNSNQEVIDITYPIMGSSIGLGDRIPNTKFTDRWLLPMTRRFESSEDIQANVSRLGVDAIVVGSDQIWRPRYAKSVLPDLFLNFLPENSPIRRISYAASFGTTQWEFTEEQTKQAKEWVKAFDGISVREDSAIKMCKKYLNVNPKHVLDPTLLLTPKDYDQIIAACEKTPKPGCLRTYILDVSEDKIQFVEELSRALGTTPCMTNGLPFPPNKANVERRELATVDKSVEGWVAAVHSASFVATDSFHGVAFSILFNKPFIAYGNKKRGLARFRSVLAQVGLQDRLVIKTEDMSIERAMQPIDWDNVNARLQKLRIESFDFLEKAINSKLAKENNAGRKIPYTAIEAVNKHPVMLFQTAKSTPTVLPDADEKGPTAEGNNPLNVLCTGCGACVAESNGSLSMVWDGDGFLVPRANGGSIPLEATRVCPFNPVPEAAVADEDKLGEIFLGDAKNYDLKAGYYINSYIGYSKKFRTSSSSGGLASYVLERLLESNYVDWIYVVESDGSSGYSYAVIEKASDIKRTSKTRYYPVTLEGLFSEIEKRPGRVAITGVACFLKAVRLQQYYNPHLKERIIFLVGIICGGLKSRKYTDFLAQSAGIQGEYRNPQYRVKNPDSNASDYSFLALDSNENKHSVRMQELGDMWGTGMFKARACDYCTDVLTELADISLGDAWLPNYRPDGLGHSVVVTRSVLADTLIREGIESRDLIMDKVPVEKISQSQKAGFNHKQNSIYFRILMGRKNGVTIPYIRPRLLKKVTMAEAMVQLLRERTRSESLRLAKVCKDINEFNRKMKSRLITLRGITKARKEGRVPVEKLRHAMHGNAEGDAPELSKQPVLRWWLRRIRMSRSTNLKSDMLLAISDSESEISTLSK